jgi:hypothetical protein
MLKIFLLLIGVAIVSSFYLTVPEDSNRIRLMIRLVLFSDILIN